MSEVVWEKEAEKALAGVPFFMRGLVRRKLEERAKSQGCGVVTLKKFQEAEARIRPVMVGKASDEMKQMMPHENVFGVEMVIIDVCHHEMSDCPNVLIQTADWKKIIEDFVREKNVSERLRARIKGDRILRHHKLHISISGCPNGCSRPQIADVGLVGFVRPSVKAEDCTMCGSCENACPDEAISVNCAPPKFDMRVCQGCVQCRNACPVCCIDLSPPVVRVLLGGKLGRHPRFAEMVCEETDPPKIIELLDRVISNYIEHAKPEERFADFLIRTHTNS